MMSQIQDLLPASPPNPPLPRAIARVVRAREKGAVLYYDFGGHILLPPPLQSKVIDKSGHWNNGKLKNDAHVENGRLKLDGVDDYVKVPDSDSLDIGTSDFTISTRLYIRRHKNFNWLFVSTTLGISANRGYGIEIGSDGKVYISLNDGDYLFEKSIGSALNTKKWYRLTAVFDRDDSVTIYINGEVVGKRDISGYSGDLSNPRPNLLGAYRERQNWFDGELDYFYIYNQALSKEEIRG